MMYLMDCISMIVFSGFDHNMFHAVYVRFYRHQHLETLGNPLTVLPQSANQIHPSFPSVMLLSV